jgi:hypothetical protein
VSTLSADNRNVLDATKRSSDGDASISFYDDINSCSDRFVVPPNQSALSFL